MDVRIEPSWKEALKEEFEKEYFRNLTEFVKDEYKKTAIYPPPKFIFHAFDLCPFEKVSAVILGQDPYHGLGQAHGLCFSVPENIAVPPSLRNIYQEIANDVGGKIPTHGNLEHWAKSGVLLLNATLTVRSGQAGSHQHQGWEEFTDAAIRALSEKKEGLVFLLWGKYAKDKKALIDGSKHLILEAAHPSPFSAYDGFFGCKHFSQANEYLKAKGKEPITWLL